MPDSHCLRLLRRTTALTFSRRLRPRGRQRSVRRAAVVQRLPRHRRRRYPVGTQPRRRIV
eukprot:3097450-Pleurochrysis_carterae.AAC.1